ncbi:ribonuclease H-like domain-containing protein [Tanacetum coccineum]
MFLSQKKYALEFLDRAHMASCNLTRTPVDSESKLGIDADPVYDPTLYCSLSGGLEYLTFTHPDISYAVQEVCLHMHDSRKPHFSALERVLRYVHGTLDFGLQLYASSIGFLVAYFDADWVDCPSTRRSTFGYCVSSAEAEYKGVVNVVTRIVWLHNLLCELHTLRLCVILVYCDNVSAIYMTANPVQHQRTKHIEIDIHFVGIWLLEDRFVYFMPSRYQHGDISTKGLPSALFEEFHNNFSVRSPVQTARGC